MKDKLISLRISQQNFSSIERKAKEEGLTVSALIRQLIQQGLIHSSPNLSNSDKKKDMSQFLKKYNLRRGRKIN